MRILLAFLLGAAVGIFGTALAVRDDLRGETPVALAADRSTGARPESPAPARASVTPAPAPARPFATPPRRFFDGDDIAIPVASFTREQLVSNFGVPRGGGRTHGAIDILAPRGTPVVASVDGKIEKLFTSAGGGLTIYLFDEEQEWIYYYAHLDRYATGLEEGEKVERGRVIGYVGTTGNAPPNTPHLHFGIERLSATREWWKGTPIDPYPVLMARGVTVNP